MDTKGYIESGILEAYLLGAIAPAEQAEVAADIARYPELADELRNIETAMHQYWVANAVEPPANLQDKIWNAIQESNSAGNESSAAKSPKIIPFQPEYNSKPTQWKYAAIWVALAGSLLVNMLLWYQGSQLRDERVSLENKIDTVQGRQEKLATLVGNYQKATGMMADTGMQTIVMHTIVQGHPMAATLYWSKNKGEAYVSMDALPQPPKGMQYQLWAMQGGKPVDMGVLPNNMASTPEMQKVSKGSYLWRGFCHFLGERRRQPYTHLAEYIRHGQALLIKPHAMGVAHRHGILPFHGIPVFYFKNPERVQSRSIRQRPMK